MSIEDIEKRIAENTADRIKYRALHDNAESQLRELEGELEAAKQKKNSGESEKMIKHG